MLSLITVALLICSWSSGHALTCLSCQQTTSSDPDINPDADPNAPTCNAGVSVPCEDGVGICMTLIIRSYFTKGSDPVILTQEMRGCADRSAPYTESLCVDSDTFNSLAASAKMELPPESGLTFDTFNGSLCVCDSDDCTAPSPSSGNSTSGPAGSTPQSEPGVEPAAQDKANATMQTTTKGGASEFGYSLFLIMVSFSFAVAFKHTLE